MGGVPQISTRTHFESISIMPQTALVQHGHHANNDLCKWNVDTVSEASQNDQDCTTKDASPYRPNKETIQNGKKEKVTSMKEAEKQREKESFCATDEETAEGSEQSSNKDQDSDVSFQEDEDEEIDECEKEEEWIEFIKRSTKKSKIT